LAKVPDISSHQGFFGEVAKCTFNRAISCSIAATRFSNAEAISFSVFNIAAFYH